MFIYKQKFNQIFFLLSLILNGNNVLANDYTFAANCNNNLLTITKMNITTGVSSVVRNGLDACNGVSSNSEIDVVNGIFYISDNGTKWFAYDYINNTMSTGATISPQPGTGGRIAPDINESVSTKITTNTNAITSNTNAINTMDSKLTDKIHGSAALTSALTALPTSSPDSKYTCGIGTGINDSSTALAAGCALDYNDRVSFNVGSSFLANDHSSFSNNENMSIKAGVSFKFGPIKDKAYISSENVETMKEMNDVIKENIELKKVSKKADSNTSLHLLREVRKLANQNKNLKNEIDNINVKLDLLLKN